MTTEQRQARTAMRERNIGALYTGQRWTWLTDVREGQAAAVAVLTSLGLR